MQFRVHKAVPDLSRGPPLLIIFFSAQRLDERDPVQYKKQTFIGHSFLR